MKQLDVQHYLRIYQTRLKMQRKGVTNPRQEIKDFTKDFVEKLSAMPINEKIVLDNHSFYNSKGKLIATVPKEKDNT